MRGARDRPVHAAEGIALFRLPLPDLRHLVAIGSVLVLFLALGLAHRILLPSSRTLCRQARAVDKRQPQALKCAATQSGRDAMNAQFTMISQPREARTTRWCRRSRGQSQTFMLIPTMEHHTRWFDAGRSHRGRGARAWRQPGEHDLRPGITFAAPTVATNTSASTCWAGCRTTTTSTRPAREHAVGL